MQNLQDQWVLGSAISTQTASKHFNKQHLEMAESQVNIRSVIKGPSVQVQTEMSA